MATQALGSYWERVEYSLTYLSFASFNAPYYPVRFMYGKRTTSIQFFILRLIILCALWSRKYGNCSQTSFIQTTLFRQKCQFSEVSGKSEPDLQPRGAFGAILPKFFCASPNFVLQRYFYIKKYGEHRSRDSRIMFCAPPPKPSDLGYGSGLSERWKGKQKQTVESDELSTSGNM